MSIQRFSLEGKVALVTGASSGIGAQYTRVLASAGAMVIAAARRKDRLDELVAEIDSAGGKAIAVEMDVTNTASVKAAFDAGEAAFGTVTIAVCNAGIGLMTPVHKVQEDEFDATMEVNLKGVWRTATEAIQRMLKANVQGSIINTASILGMNATRGGTTYCASKAAVVNMTKAMALDVFRRGIRVNAICPGYFITEINDTNLDTEKGAAMLAATPAGRAGDLDELGGPLLLLASDAGSFMSGTTLAVDGGHLAQVQG